MYTGNAPVLSFHPINITVKLNNLPTSGAGIGTKKAYLQQESIRLMILMTQPWVSVSFDCMATMFLHVRRGYSFPSTHVYRCGPHSRRWICFSKYVGVFSNFEKDGEFYCYPGQSNQSVTAMYNMYRASQVAFTGEEVLSRAHTYCHQFLHGRRSTNKLQDKWVIAKDLAGEVLPTSWHQSIQKNSPRLCISPLTLDCITKLVNVHVQSTSIQYIIHFWIVPF